MAQPKIARNKYGSRTAFVIYSDHLRKTCKKWEPQRCRHTPSTCHAIWYYTYIFPLLRTFRSYGIKINIHKPFLGTRREVSLSGERISTKEIVSAKMKRYGKSDSRLPLTGFHQWLKIATGSWICCPVSRLVFRELFAKLKNCSEQRDVHSSWQKTCTVYTIPLISDLGRRTFETLSALSCQTN
jgi:hypothetical protein